MSGTGRVEGRSAIVVGGGQGIGRGAALALGREGAHVMVADIDAAAAERTAAEAAAGGCRALPWKVDAADPASFTPLVEAAVRAFGRLDILVYSAGVVQIRPFLEITEAEWDRVLDVNLKGLFFCIQAAARRMIDQEPAAGTGRGRIVAFSSISGRRGRADQAHYAASKAAIISVTQSAALAFAPYGINVNAIAPSVVATRMWEDIDRDRGRLEGLGSGEAMRRFVERIPLKRTGTPEDMAGAVLFLCSADAGYITGQTLNVDGGFEMD